MRNRVQMLECVRGGFCSSHVCAQGAKANPLSAVAEAVAAVAAVVGFLKLGQSVTATAANH